MLLYLVITLTAEGNQGIHYQVESNVVDIIVPFVSEQCIHKIPRTIASLSDFAVKNLAAEVKSKPV